MLIDLQIPPGIYRQGTEYQSRGRYYDSNLVRFYKNTLRPIGGWRKLKQSGNAITVNGLARGSHAWRVSGSNDPYLAIGTQNKLFYRLGTVNNVIDITPIGYKAGFGDTQFNTGFGGGAFGVDTYGSPRTPSSFANIATTTSLDNFGDFLVGVQSEDGRLFYWDLSASRAVFVTATAGSVPTMNKGVLVTDERFVFLLQAGGNRRRVAWSDQENLFNWQITATTQAGDFDLQTNGEIMLAKRARGQTLILTSTDAHVANYIGPPLVFGFERVGEGCGAISRNSAVTTGNSAVAWMGIGNFFIFDGFVKEIPCEVSDHVFPRINRAQAAKVWASYDPNFNEVTWYYPVGMEIDSYVTYSIAENHWTIGSLSRTTGVDNSVYPSAIRIDATGALYEHEVGFDYEGAIPFAQTGPVELGKGDQVVMCKYLYPDEKTQGQVQARFATKFYPNSQEYPFGPYQMSNPTSIRFTGRQVAMRIEGVEQTDWRVGIPRIDVELGGLR